MTRVLGLDEGTAGAHVRRRSSSSPCRSRSSPAGCPTGSGASRSSSASISAARSGSSSSCWPGRRCLAVGRDLPDGPVLVRREPAAPGPARRHLAAVDARRHVRGLLHDGVRGRVALDALYGIVIEQVGEAAGVPVVFVLMAVLFVLAALGTVPIQAERRARENAAFEATLEGSGDAAARSLAARRLAPTSAIGRRTRIRGWTPGSCSSRTTRRSARSPPSACATRASRSRPAVDGRGGPRPAFAAARFDLVLLDVMLPRARRPGGLPRDPADLDGAGRDADRPRGHDRRRRRARSRRRRLREEAVRGPGTRRARPGRAPAGRRARRTTPQPPPRSARSTSTSPGARSSATARTSRSPGPNSTCWPSSTRHAGQVLSRDILLDRIWGYDYLGDSRLVDVAMQRLRAKVEADPANPALMVTVRGAGYKAVR